MRDDSKRWDALTGSVASGASFHPVRELEQVLVSGTDVQSRFASDLVTWPELVTAQTYALSLRRDRVLLCGAYEVAAGFDPKTGHAVTDVSDAYEVIDLEGPDTFALLCTGAELQLDIPSRSVTRLFFGVEVMLYRVAETRFRLHLPRPLAASILDRLKASPAS